MKPLFLVLALLYASAVQATSLSLDDVLAEIPTLDTALPTPEQITGVKVGERHWYHYEIVNYLEALAEASPRMVALGEHACT